LAIGGLHGKGKMQEQGRPAAGGNQQMDTDNTDGGGDGEESPLVFLIKGGIAVRQVKSWENYHQELIRHDYTMGTDAGAAQAW
jgi:hypothetical protein